MKKLLGILAGGLGLLGILSSMSVAEVISERGEHALNEISQTPGDVNIETSFARPARSWASAPPTIPHKIDAYKITTKINLCTSCHERNYKRMKAPKMPITHYLTSAGQVNFDRLDGRRYFCTQCHVPQAKVTPLVKNTFDSVTAPKLDEKAHARGKELAEECMSCHTQGENVDGVRFLGGWETTAMEQVLKAYKNGDIRHEEMNAIAEDMEDEDMKAVSSYFATLKGAK